MTNGTVWDIEAPPDSIPQVLSHSHTRAALLSHAHSCKAGGRFSTVDFNFEGKKKVSEVSLCLLCECVHYLAHFLE